MTSIHLTLNRRARPDRRLPSPPSGLGRGPAGSPPSPLRVLLGRGREMRPVGSAGVGGARPNTNQWPRRDALAGVLVGQSGAASVSRPRAGQARAGLYMAAPPRARRATSAGKGRPATSPRVKLRRHGRERLRMREARGCHFRHASLGHARRARRSSRLHVPARRRKRHLPLHCGTQRRNAAKLEQVLEKPRGLSYRWSVATRSACIVCGRPFATHACIALWMLPTRQALGAVSSPSRKRSTRSAMPWRDRRLPSVTPRASFALRPGPDAPVAVVTPGHFCVTPEEEIASVAPYLNGGARRCELGPFPLRGGRRPGQARPGVAAAPAGPHGRAGPAGPAGHQRKHSLPIPACLAAA